MKFMHLSFIMAFSLISLLACKPAPPQLESDLSSLVLTASKEVNRLDTLQQRIKTNQAALDFALQPDIAENSPPQSEPVMLDPLANLSSEEKAQLELSASDLVKEWSRHQALSDELLQSISSLTNQIAHLKNQMDLPQNDHKLNRDNLSDLSPSLKILQENLNQLEAATLDCQSRTLIFLSGNPALLKGATYLQSNSPGLKK
jgi:chromosome segregation ATPase